METITNRDQSLMAVRCADWRQESVQNMQKVLLLAFFSPKQLGVSASSGCKAAVHAARQYVLSPKHVNLHNVQVLIKVDLRNLFNELNRPAILKKLLLRFPQAFPFMNQAYQA